MALLTEFVRAGYARLQALTGRSPSKRGSKQALTESAESDAALYAQARLLHQQGHLTEAEPLYRDLLQKHPQDFDVLHFLGMILGQRGNFESAIALIAQAIEVNPNHAIAYISLGNCQQGLAQHEAALKSYDHALALNPNSSDVLNNRGAVLRDLNRFAEALTSFDKALAINPNNFMAHDNRGMTLTDLKRPEDALVSHANALAINADYAPAHYHTAVLLLANDQSEAAIAEFAKALLCNPEHRAAQSFMLHTQQKMCAWNEFDAHVASLRRSIANPIDTLEGVICPFITLPLPGFTPYEQKLCAENWTRVQYKAQIAERASLAFDLNRPLGKKINLGYLSPDFREHPMPRLLAEVFEQHNRDEFTVTAYSFGRDDNSAMRERLLKSFDQFIDIRALTDVEAARKIYEDKIDILVDLGGYTANSRVGLLALRPARLQVSYLGYLGTMGADFIDYLIADRHIVPADQQIFYTEKILYLPNCFQPNDRTRPRPPSPTRAQNDLPENAFVFCCFNQTVKITPELFDVWCRLLRELPDSVLWLVASKHNVANNLRTEAQQRGVDPARLLFAPEVTIESYLARMQCADLFLDTAPYNAGTVCSDALWMGLPIIACTGNTFASRMAGSLLLSLELPELITQSLEDYYALAFDLATHRNRLDAIRNKLAVNRTKASLFDSFQFTRDLEGAYQKIVNR